MFKAVIYYRDIHNRTTQRVYQLTTSDAAQALVDARLLALEAQDNTRLSVYRYRVIYDGTPESVSAPESDSNIDFGLTVRGWNSGYHGVVSLQIPDPAGALVREDGTAFFMTEFGALNHFFSKFLVGGIAKTDDGKQIAEYIDGVLDR